MAAETPTVEPTTIIAGDTLRWQIALGDYLATDGWTLNYALRNAMSHYDIVSTASGADHLIEVNASDTATWAPGVYNWTAYVESVSERFTVRRGTFTVTADPANPVPQEFRTQAAKAVDDLKTALATFKATGGRVKRYSIAGRDIEFESLGEMMKLLSMWQRELANEEAAARLNTGKASPLLLQVRL
jgi:hypothetical protein